MTDKNEALEHINMQVNGLIDAGYSLFEIREALLLKADDLATENVKQAESIRNSKNTVVVTVDIDDAEATRKLKKLRKQAKKTIDLIESLDEFAGFREMVADGVESQSNAASLRTAQAIYRGLTCRGYTNFQANKLLYPVRQAIHELD